MELQDSTIALWGDIVVISVLTGILQKREERGKETRRGERGRRGAEKVEGERGDKN